MSRISWQAELEETFDRRRKERLEWQKQVEEKIDRRFLEAKANINRRRRRTLLVQFLLSSLATFVVLIAAKYMKYISF